MILEKIELDYLLDNGKKIICFGCGKAFDKLLELFEETFLVSQILYIVDNNPNMWGTVKSINGKNIFIVSPNYFIEHAIEDTLALITVQQKEDIIKQYQNIEKLSNTPAIWYRDIMSEYCTKQFDKIKLPVELRKTNKRLIPKIIHYCWFGKKEIPYENRVWMESWEKYCPDYKIIQWNENNYDITKNLYMKEAYEKARWGFATDYARLDIIYQNGGIYLDTDVELVKNLDELLYQPAFMGWEDGLRVNTGLGFGGVKKLELFREMRDYYNDLNFIKKDGSCDLTACPTFQTKVLKKYGLIKNGEYQVVKNITILPVSYLCGKASYIKKDIKTESTFSIHHFQGSWRM